VIAVGDVLDAGVGTQCEQHQEESFAQRCGRHGLAGGDRGEAVDQADVVVGLGQEVEQVNGAPTRLDRGLDPFQVRGLGLFGRLRHGDPRPPGPGADAHPCRVVRGQGSVEVAQRGGQLTLQAADELARVQRLTEPFVVSGAVGVEIGGQVDVRVTPPDRAEDPHLAASDRLAQRGQHAQLVRDPLHPAGAVLAFLGHRRAPVGRHDPVQRHRLFGGVVATLCRWA